MALIGWTAGEEPAGLPSVPSSHMSGDPELTGWIDQTHGGPTGPGVEVDSESSAPGAPFSGGEDEEKTCCRKKPAAPQ